MNAPAPAAVTGTYSDLKFIKTRSVAVISVEIPIESANAFVAAFGTPQPGAEVHVAIARLNGTPKPEPAPAASAGRLPSPKHAREWCDVPSAEQAGIRCAEPRFWKFMEEAHGTGPIKSADTCRDALYALLGITSRRQIDENPAAFRGWEALDIDYRDFCFSEGREVR